MARKAQASPAVEEAPPPPPPLDPKRFAPPANEVEAAVIDLARQFNVKVDLSPRDRYVAIQRALARKGKPPPRQCHWDVLREYTEGKRDGMAAANAAVALGLGITDALEKSRAGWTASGPPARERVPGEDDE